MSEDITVTGSSTPVTIYGTFAGANDYINDQYGPQYTAWLAMTPDDQKRTMITAVRFLESFAWNTTTAADFATRDAIEAFAEAEYELAVLVKANPKLTGNADQGSNVRAVGAGSARVEFFNPTSAAAGSAPLLPPVVDRLVGKYLAARATGVSGGVSSSGSDCPQFGCGPELGRKWPF